MDNELDPAMLLRCLYLLTDRGLGPVRTTRYDILALLLCEEAAQVGKRQNGVMGPKL